MRASNISREILYYPFRAFAPEPRLNAPPTVAMIADDGRTRLVWSSGIAAIALARGYYAFFSHLRWAPVIALGYVASILMHLWIN